MRAARDHLDSGRLTEAELTLQTILASRPNHGDALNLLAGVALLKGNLPKAIAALEQAAEANPRDAGIQFNLAGAYRRSGMLEQAVARYALASRLKRGFVAAEGLKGEVLREMGDWEGAHAAYAAALSHDRTSALALNGIGLCLAQKRDWVNAVKAFSDALEQLPANEALKRSHVLLGLGTSLLQVGAGQDGVSALVEAATLAPANEELLLLLGRNLRNVRVIPRHAAFPGLIKRLFEDPRANPRTLSSAAAQILRDDQPLSEALERSAQPNTAIDATHLERLLKHTLLLLHLRSAPITDQQLELWLTGLRRNLLVVAARDGSDDLQRLMPLISALAQQAYLNEYVWYEGRDEGDAVDQLLRKWPTDRSWPSLAMLACYRPLASLGLPITNRNDAPGDLRPLLTQQIDEPAEEMRIATEITELTAINDAVSIAVRQQYEENPYPRWVRVGKRTPHAFRTVIRGIFPHLEPDVLPKTDTPRTLIAGCGTGLETVSVLNQLTVGSMLAVDLSRSSLAYGMRKLGELGFTNVEYRHGDILELEHLDDRFDLIHSFGVIHHMADPIKGLAVLTRALEPGGFIFLGLYSRIARSNLNVARELITQQRMEPNADNIRRFRHDIMMGRADSRVAGIVNAASDFWTLSECRDLMFHVEEHQYTLQDIAKMFDNAGLQFVGIEVDFAPDLERFREEHPSAHDLKSLQAWHSFEERYPETFGGTYRLWARKPD